MKRKKNEQNIDSKQALKNLQFLEDMRVLNSKVSSKSKLISIKIPENLLRAFQFDCEKQNIKYQTQIKKLMWEWLERQK